MVKIGTHISGQWAREAGYIEDLGLDSVWAGDHLANDMPMIDLPSTLATAAAVSTRLELAGVMLVALRPAAWSAKQIGSLQTLSGNRLLLGVGVGGQWPDEWAAAGVPIKERGRRTDDLLKALPSLLAGHATETPDTGVVIRLTPPTPTPPIWIAGNSPRALRRAGELGNGWYPAMISPAGYTEGLAKIREIAAAAGRPAPTGGVQLFGTVASTPDTVANILHRNYDLPLEVGRQIVVCGGPRQVADRINSFVAAGAAHVTVVGFDDDWRKHAENLAEAKRLLQV
jgi:alkanesulfonate monooxygenase SsuD/methylene tetrahydromethanopterin reductase-like flavin-dependent oxidoreductase (luciferase family)